MTNPKIAAVSNKRIDIGNPRRVFNVESSEVKVTYEDGSDTNISFNEVVRAKQTRDSVAFIPYRTEDGEVLVYLRHALRPVTKRDGVERGPGSGMLIEAPAGTFEKYDPETRVGALQRAVAELKEECGIEHYWTAVPMPYPLYTTPGMVGERMWGVYFDVTDIEPKTPKGDGSVMEVGCWCEWMGLDDALYMVNEGKIVDMKTVLLLQHLDRVAGDMG